MLSAKNYQNRPMFHGVIQRNISGAFLFKHGVDIIKLSNIWTKWNILCNQIIF